MDQRHQRMMLLILLNITGSSNLGLHEVSIAASAIYEAVHKDANIIFGSVIDESMGESISVTIVATGFSPRTPYSSQPKSQNIQKNYSEKISSDEKTSEEATVDLNDLEVPALVRRTAQRMQNYNNI